MPVLILQQILDILRSGQLDQLVGAIEDEIMDAKSEPYQLDAPRHKLELAKDVAAFANGRGGVILIGARTVRSPVHLGDEIAEVRPLRRDLVDPDRYHAVLREWIYPQPGDVTLTWYPQADRQDRGIIAIVVPDQPIARRPFLITHALEEGTTRFVDITFGYVERRGAGVDPMKVQGLQSLLRDGQRADEVQRRLDGLTGEMAQLREAVQGRAAAAAAPTPAMTANELLARRREAVEASGLRGRPLFSLAAIPTPALELPGFFLEDSALVRALDDPPQLRPGGFDLNLSRRTRLIAGQLRRAARDGLGALELGREGVLLFVIEADFLCWGTRVPNGPLRINPLALCESTYAFAQLSALVCAQAARPPASLEYGLLLYNFTIDEHRAQLIPGPLGTMRAQFGMDVHEAPNASASLSIRWEAPEVHPGNVAFRLVREVYGWFGIGENEIPYTSAQDGERAIDEAAIRRLRT